MPTIQLNNFGGIMPKIHPTLLPQTGATKAHNCVLKNGKLVPLRMPLLEEIDTISYDIVNFNEAKTIFKWDNDKGSQFVLFQNIIDCVLAMFVENNRYMFYIAGQTNIGKNHHDICVCYQSDDGNLKTMSLVKPPPPDLEIEREGEEIPEDEENIRYTFFFQTWVDELGYESEVSNPSKEIEYVDGDSISISEWDTTGGDLNSFKDAKKRRIYKVITGSETGQIQFIYEQEINDEGVFPQISINVKDEDAGEIITPINSVHDKVNGIVALPGFYAMWCKCTPKTVRFSENAPTNFPEEYAYEVEYDIVGLAAIGNVVYVLTTGSPFLISGTSPDAMIVTKIASPQPCISRRTICIVDNIVFYVSYDGICSLSDGKVTVITKDFFSKDEWKEVISDDMVMCGYDNKLLLWTNKSSKKVGYIFDFTNKTVTTFDEYTNALYVDVVSGKLFFIKENEEQETSGGENGL